MISVVVADDQIMVRQSLRETLDKYADLKVVGEASTGAQAIELVESLKPDILVLDLMVVTVGINGIEVIRRLRMKRLKTGIVVLSMYSGETCVIEALRNGARAYILKDKSVDELALCIHKVYERKLYLCEPLIELVVKTLMKHMPIDKSDPYEQLTPKEREILPMAAQGNSNANIAAELKISPRTVETHRCNAMRKLGIRGQSSLFKFAISRGIIQTDSMKVHH
jgi:DNA-binding NarL/FixJ family response regulator